jgi:lytic murein transglycosylase
MKIILTTLVLVLSLCTQALSQSCGGNFASFVDGLRSEARQNGHGNYAVEGFFATVTQDPKVIAADRAQGVFQLPFMEFSGRLISNHRMFHGAKNADDYSWVFDEIKTRFGISRGILLAFWGFETDFGSVQGSFNTLNSLVTLAHDCRRPELFRPQIFAALKLYERGNFDPAVTQGAWAGEIGMVQMLPEDILVNGIDGDGDGLVSMKTSAPDALMSGANMLRSLGWRANEPWMEEVSLPMDFDWSLTGFHTQQSGQTWERLGVRSPNGTFKSGDLASSIILPQGHSGPAFMVYPNFSVLFEWNQSFVYVITAAYFATLLEGGAPVMNADADPGLNGEKMKQLQTKLVQLGYDVGKIDGILGAKTRAAVQSVQQKLSMPADAWPTYDLLNFL